VWRRRTFLECELRVTIEHNQSLLRSILYCQMHRVNQSCRNRFMRRASKERPMIRRYQTILWVLFAVGGFWLATATQIVGPTRERRLVGIRCRKCRTPTQITESRNSPRMHRPLSRSVWANSHRSKSPMQIGARRNSLRFDSNLLQLRVTERSCFRATQSPVTWACNSAIEYAGP
jgi:hypothetical protein